MKFTCKRVSVLLFLTASCLVTLLGRIYFDQMFNKVMNSQIQKNMALKNGTESFKNWVKPPVPVLFQIYLFDVVNAMEVVTKNEVPVVMEKGPYVYKLIVEKEDIKIHDNHTIQFRQPEAYVFDREASVGPETDTVTSLNCLFYILAQSLKHQPAIVQEAVSSLFTMQGDGAFVTKSLRDIWWGYDDKVLKELAELLERLHVNVTIPSKFGFNLDKNNTDAGLLNIYSGTSGNFENFEVIDRWNGLRKLKVWNSHYANRIVGTDSSAQPPPLKKYKNLSFFDPHLQRSFNLDYTKSTKVGGVDAYHYVIPYSDFASAEDNPNNAGFCTPDVTHCLPSGSFNLSITAQGAPLVLSMPHFVGGDPIYQKQVRGLRPSQKKHQPFIEYHPLTGVNLHSARRYQIVMHLKQMEHFTAFKNVRDTFLPIMWIDGTGRIDNATLHLFKTKMQDFIDSMVYVKAALVVIVCLTALMAIGLVLYWRKKDKKKGGIARSSSDDRLLLPHPRGEINTSYDDYRHLSAVTT
ncbi:hypothetical protein RRG08_039675 [Elysia crispata]|uniref:Uncharacterized protein n=1 Tax=Elysia crispata TaxID=231223 RepID=A0AAE1CV64_9GAST|nr:hypothetical protein RRG08_039675 [Elysia crispata]